jgi:hypothetical protein
LLGDPKIVQGLHYHDQHEIIRTGGEVARRMLKLIHGVGSAFVKAVRNDVTL